MNKNLILAFALFSLPVFAEEDLGPGKYVVTLGFQPGYRYSNSVKIRNSSR